MRCEVSRLFEFGSFFVRSFSVASFTVLFELQFIGSIDLVFEGDVVLGFATGAN